MPNTTTETETRRKHLEAARALVARLEAGAATIESERRAGATPERVSRLEEFWIDLLHLYEAEISDALAFMSRPVSFTELVA
jgi:hypothetical protein